MKIWSYTFGCKVNQYETELLRHRMLSAGDCETSEIGEADLCLINTCSVTAFADKEARQMIRRVLRENPSARTVVTGCYATRAPQEIKDISDRLEIYSNLEKDELPMCVGYEVAQKPLGIHQFSGRTRAFLKIQDGCKASCNYCIIPTVRPDMRSKPVEHVLKEFKELLLNGYQEIVLTGIRLGLYMDGSAGGARTNLTALLKKLIELPGIFRIRLSSLEVTEISLGLLDLISKTDKICRHFHMPLQSGDSDVLADMERWYDAAYYRDKVHSIRKVLPDCGLTADVMVGYPTESDEQFLNTKRLIEEMNLSGLHVFRFSAREGTKAARLKPLDPRVVMARAHELGALDEKLRERFYRRFEGQLRQVLPEPLGEGWSDNYIRVDVPQEHFEKGLAPSPVWAKKYLK